MSTKKIEKFIREPVGDKHVREVGGIGKTYGKQLKKEDYKFANDLLIEFRRLKESEERFKKFLRKHLRHPSERTLDDCYESMAGWCKNHPKEKRKLLKGTLRRPEQ